jgi:hypothetical protein
MPQRTADCRMTAADYLFAITLGIFLPPPPKRCQGTLEPRRAPPPDGAFSCARTRRGADDCTDRRHTSIPNTLLQEQPGTQPPGPTFPWR